MSVAAALARLGDLAEAQNGLVTTRQAHQLQVARRDLARLTASGGLERVAHGIYRVAGAPRPRLLELRAAWLQLAPGAPVDERRLGDGAVSHASATLVYQVGLLDPARHEFTVPHQRRVRSRRSDVVIHHAPIAETEARWVEEILVTTPTRLVADLCAASTDGEHLGGVIADLIARRLASRRDLVTAATPYAASYGAADHDGADLLDMLTGRTGGRR